ncbi:hypothetical protein PIB30_001389 [Stylosanthes scabra]|uniref:Uncharacterized protein n=1 Tax=Stylosanthes scabra TaxID=79078 RepID=A0ABU6Z4Q8_9FABA|nr:hypothetical protein [Stylosanthes scabra]
MSWSPFYNTELGEADNPCTILYFRVGRRRSSMTIEAGFLCNVDEEYVPKVGMTFVSCVEINDFYKEIFCLKSFKRNLSRTNEVPTLHYSAFELNKAGVKLKIEVDDGTETWFRNMVALEQCHYLKESYITNYVIFIGHLVNEGKDVDVLVKNKIIVNRLGDNETVAELFRGLKRDIMVMNFDAEYTHICNQLNAHYENFWHKMMATLRIGYFSIVWKTAASVAAIILLFFTAIQTLCSVLSIVKY